MSKIIIPAVTIRTIWYCIDRGFYCYFEKPFEEPKYYPQYVRVIKE